MTSEPDPTAEGAVETGFEERLDAVERALTGSDMEVTDVDGGAAAAAERETLAKRLDSVEERIEELEAATQAVRGYAGAIRSVNREVERRADLALARATDARDAARPRDQPGTGRDEIGTGPRDVDAADELRATDRGTNAPEVPTDAAIEAAIPGDDHATGRNHGSDARNRGSCEDHGPDEENSDEGPLERLRDAL
ncbi:hypothetical protein J2751_002168 [Halorubrum alkaliphilum]|uniref:DUF7310 domain-containing protein n=1 Tax=Halorubrum alkaliphilum TaxID=261290 RepID=A0A8T4GHL7_9EURY|nr:hypothetical protein [Halorubrum alkaliphilum]MBP1923130.1 hypothetical protein [Halorubrum alkaliphilum]